MKKNRYGLCVTAVAVVLVCVLVVQTFWPFSGSKTNSQTVEYVNGEYYCIAEPKVKSKVTGTKDAIETAAELFALSGEPTEILEEELNGQFLGETYYRLNQMSQGLPVYGRGINVTADQDGKVVFAASNYTAVDEIDTVPAIGEAEAVASVREYLAEVFGISEDVEIQLLGIHEEGLCIYELNGDGTHLAYKCQMTFSGEEGYGSYDLVLDAHNGQVLSCITNIYTDQQEYIYRHITGKEYHVELENESDGTLLFYDKSRNFSVYNCEGDYLKRTYLPMGITTASQVEDILLYRSENNSMSDAEILKIYTLQSGVDEYASEDDREAIQLLANAQTTWDFYNEILKHPGYDGAKSPMKLVFNTHETDDISGWKNAASGTYINWKMGLLYFNIWAEVNEIDLIAHEYTHSVERTISGMEYAGQSGGLMEAYSDIFGELAEAYESGKDPDWEHGDRSLNVIPKKSKNIYHISDFTEKMDVHDSSTIASHAAYLLWDSWRNISISVDECIKDMAFLLYRSLYSMRYDSTFADWGWIVEQTALRMLKEGELSTEQMIMLRPALDAVGISVDEIQGETEEAFWNDVLLEIAVLAIENEKMELTKDIIEKSAVRLLPNIQETAVMAGIITTSEYRRAFNDTFLMTERGLEACLISMYGEEATSQVMQDLQYFKRIEDGSWQYEAKRDRVCAADQGWTMTVGLAENIHMGDETIILAGTLKTDSGLGYGVQFCLVKNRTSYPGIFYNGYILQKIIIAKPEEREEITEIADDNTLLHSKLEELVNTYDIIATGTEEFSCDPALGEMDIPVPAGRITGLLFADIFDYDGDGEDELLTLRLEAQEAKEVWNEVAGKAVLEVDETQIYVEMYDYAADGLVREVQLADSLTIPYSGLMEALYSSSIHVFRGNNGKYTNLYLDYYYHMNSQSFGVAEITYEGGALSVTGGMGCSEFAASAVCDLMMTKEALGSLLGRQRFIERNGWMDGVWYDTEEMTDMEEVERIYDNYREEYQKVLSAIGLHELDSRTNKDEEDISVQSIYGDCYSRPLEHYEVIRENLALTELGGVISPYAQGGVTLTCYDNTGWLDAYRN